MVGGCVLCRALAAWCLHTVGIVEICLGINLFWYKFYSACLDMPNRIHSIRIYSEFILCLFWYKSGYKPFIPILVVTQCGMSGEIECRYRLGVIRVPAGTKKLVLVLFW